jgi:hypothetical protein
MGDHLFKLGHQIEDAQHEWDLAMAAMAASTAIGIGLTFFTFVISDIASEGAAAAAVSTMEAITTALDLSLDAAVQVLATAIRVAAQLTVRFTWQFEINLVSQEAANVIEGRGLDKLDLLQAAEFAGASMLIPGLASRVTIGGTKVLEGASGAVMTGALTDAGIQGLEGITEGKPFNPGEVVVAGTLAGAGHIAGEEISAHVNKEVPKQGVPPKVDLRVELDQLPDQIGLAAGTRARTGHFASEETGALVDKKVANQGVPSKVDVSFELEQHPDQVALAARHVNDWGPIDTMGHTSALHRVTFEDGEPGFFKPYTGENTGNRVGFEPGTMWRNEVGVHEVDKALGFKLTATTTAVEAPVGPHGELVRGSLATYLGEGYMPATACHPVEQQRVAVLHYVTGNTDGHGYNVLLQPDGRPGVIDGGLALPRGPAVSIRSSFFPRVVGQPLDPSVVDAVRGVDGERLASRLRQTGISDEAIDGVMARLHEVQGGMITGSAYPGKLIGAGPHGWDTVPKPTP